MSDVARLAGVSVPTVSRVINGGHWVSSQTSSRVHHAIAHLGYRPNPTARALAHGGADVMGVISHASALFGPAAIVFAVERAALAAGHTTMLTTLPSFSVDSLQGAVDRLVESGAAGIVIAAIWAEDVSALGELNCPVPVVIGERVAIGSFASVGFDEVSPCRRLVEHLLGLGRHTVHHIGGAPGWSGAAQREAGWRQALEAAGAPIPAVITGDWTSSAGHAAADQLLEDPHVTAVFAANDQMALGLLAGLGTRGVRVPEDISVAGFDALDDSAFYQPPLTSIRNDYQQLGEGIINELLAQIASSPHLPQPGTQEAEPRRGIVQASIIMRNSTAPAR